MNKDDFIMPKECFDPFVNKVSIALLQHIVANNEYITYGDLAKKIGPGINPRIIEHPLGFISMACKENGIPPISVMVVNKDTLIPGVGFFKFFYPELKPDEYDFKYLELYKQVKEFKQWQDVLDIFMAI